MYLFYFCEIRSTLVSNNSTVNLFLQWFGVLKDIVKGCVSEATEFFGGYKSKNQKFFGNI